MRYSLRQMFAALAAVAVVCGVVVGLLRFGNYVVRTVERDYWQDKIAQGQYPPGKYPASLFTEQEMAKLRALTEQTSGGDTNN